MVESYSFGKIVVDGIAYKDDIKIIKGKVIPDWWRQRGHLVSLDDIVDILESDSEILVIGTGKFGMMKLSSPLREALTSKGIELIEKKTPGATKIFNRLWSEGRDVSAGFHLTC